MKLILLYIVSLFICGLSLKSQILYFDDFDSYNVEQGIAIQENNWWTTWGDNPGSDEDPIISTEYALSGIQSLNISDNNNGIINFNEVSEGRYRIQFNILIREAYQGYYRILQNFNNSDNDFITGLEAIFQNGLCTFNAGGSASATFEYEANEWIKVQHIIDINNNWIDIHVNNQLLHAYQWDIGAFDYGDGTNILDAINFYAYNQGGVSDFYIDDFLFEEIDDLPPPSNLSVEIINNNDIILSWKAPDNKTPSEYYIVRDGQIIAVSSTELTYIDENIYPDIYLYQVFAYYDSEQGFSSSSDIKEVIIPGGNPREFVLFEIFSSTLCFNCPIASQAIDSMNYDNKNIAVIKYHGGDDFETNATLDRTNFYLPFFAPPGAFNFGYPASIINGMYGFEGAKPSLEQQLETYNFYYNQYIDIPTVHTLEASIEQSQQNPYEFNLSIITTETYPYFEDEIRLMVALTEKDIPHFWQGENIVTHILRQMYPDSNGTVLEFSNETTIEETYSLSIISDYIAENCEVIIFLQNMNTGQVIATTKIDLVQDITTIAKSDINKISVYPNPSDGKVNISSNKEIISVKIINNIGQVIEFFKVNKSSVVVNTSNLANGIYFIQIQSENSSNIEKLIVN